MFAKKSQTGLEYLIITSFIFAMTVPAVFIFYNYTYETDLNIENSQVIGFLTDVVDSANKVYYLGHPSKVTLTGSVPRSVQNISAEKSGDVYLIRISFKTESGVNSISKPTKAQITYVPDPRDLQSGRKIVVQAVEQADISTGVEIRVN